MGKALASFRSPSEAPLSRLSASCAERRARLGAPPGALEVLGLAGFLLGLALISALISAGFRLDLDLAFTYQDFGWIWLDLAWIRLDFGLDFALSLAFERIFVHSSFS